VACDSERHRTSLESKKTRAAGPDTNATVSSEALSKSEDGVAGGQRSKSQNRNRSARSESLVDAAKENTVGLSTPVITAPPDNGVGPVVLNNLLMYAIFQRNRCTAASLRAVINDFYSPNEISDAKKQLLVLFESSLSGCEAITERRNSTQRTASVAEAEDITDILDVLDNAGVLDSVTFGAAQYNRLPRYGPEDLNICAIADKQVLTENSISVLTAKVDSLSGSSVQSTDILDAVSGVTAKLTALQDQVHQLAASASVQSDPRLHTRHNGNTVSSERLCNVVIYGIPESRDRDVWKSQVLVALKTAAGHEVTVSDAFRLGRYVVNKCRPILVKLHSVWDKRTVLGGSRKLAEVPEFRTIYIRADESTEVRRRKASDKIKARAVAKGYRVNEIDNTLYVNDIAVYSQSNGYIRNNVNLSYVSGSDSIPHDG